MGTGGLEWDAGDGYSAVRLNQKTHFVGTETQINAIATTYPGMTVFSTSGATLVTDHMYVRDAANAAWLDVADLSAAVTESGELSSTPIGGTTGETALVHDYRYYSFYTMPTAAPLYKITKISWWNGVTTGGSMIAGVDMVAAVPPTVTVNSTPLIALSEQVAQGATGEQIEPVQFSQIIRGGSTIGIWISGNGSIGNIDYDNDAGSPIMRKGGTAGDYEKYDLYPFMADARDWSATTTDMRIKVYYVSYS